MPRKGTTALQQESSGFWKLTMLNHAKKRDNCFAARKFRVLETNAA